MKKKIAIVTRKMVMGGIEKSLISMLESMKPEKYDVTVFVMATGGELYNDIPKWVKVECIYGNYKSTLEKIKYNIQNKNIRVALKTIYYTFLSKVSKGNSKKEMIHCKMLPIQKGYDTAISYHVPLSMPVQYVVNNINAKQKILWVHSDISAYKKYTNLYDKLYYMYDEICCVSQYSKKQFINMYPDLENKTKVIYNIVNKEKIFTLAKKGDSFKDGFSGVRILTVGRLTKEKGQDLVIDIVELLIKDNLDIRWYLIGDGEERVNLERKIKKHNLEEKVILMGTKENPYPYMRDCDIYIQPSRHEGYCITLAEAILFEKSIISTKTIGAKEQIIDKKNGLLVEFDKFKVYEAINRVLKSENLYD